MYLCKDCGALLNEEYDDIFIGEESFDHAFGTHTVTAKYCGYCGGNKLEEITQKQGYIVETQSEYKVIYKDEDLIEEIKNNGSTTVKSFEV